MLAEDIQMTRFTIGKVAQAAGVGVATEEVRLTFAFVFASLGRINGHAANWIDRGDLHSFHLWDFRLNF